MSCPQKVKIVDKYFKCTPIKNVRTLDQVALSILILPEPVDKSKKKNKKS